MPLEIASTIADLVSTNPVGASDTPAALDDHIQLIKKVLKADALVNADIGVNVAAYSHNHTGTYQPVDTELTALAGLTSAANKVPMFSGSGTATLIDFKDEDNMASDSATAVPSQQSVKAYVTTYANKIKQMVYTESTAVATGSTQIPLDDTIPQNTEGDEYITQAITPTSASSILHISATLVVGTLNNVTIIAALFQDTTANAIAATCSYCQATPGVITIKLDHFMVAGTTSATTFKVRLGPSGSSTLTFNGISSGRLFGAIGKSSISISEVTP